MEILCKGNKNISIIKIANKKLSLLLAKIKFVTCGSQNEPYL